MFLSSIHATCALQATLAALLEDPAPDASPGLMQALALHRPALQALHDTGLLTSSMRRLMGVTEGGAVKIKKGTFYFSLREK